MSESKKYEITYIVRPDIDDAAKTALVDRFDKILTDNGAQVIDSKYWSKRRFAYEIGGFNEGTYHIVICDAVDHRFYRHFLGGRDDWRAAGSTGRGLRSA